VEAHPVKERKNKRKKKEKKKGRERRQKKERNKKERGIAKARRSSEPWKPDRAEVAVTHLRTRSIIDAHVPFVKKFRPPLRDERGGLLSRPH